MKSCLSWLVVQQLDRIFMSHHLSICCWVWTSSFINSLTYREMRWKGQLLAIKYIYSGCNHPENAVKLCPLVVPFGLFMLGLECFSGGCIYFTWIIKEVSWSCNLFSFLLHSMFRNTIIAWWISYQFFSRSFLDSVSTYRT